MGHEVTEYPGIMQVDKVLPELSNLLSFFPYFMVLIAIIHCIMVILDLNYSATTIICTIHLFVLIS